MRATHASPRREGANTTPAREIRPPSCDGLGLPTPRAGFPGASRLVLLERPPHEQGTSHDPRGIPRLPVTPSAYESLIQTREQLRLLTHRESLPLIGRVVRTFRTRGQSCGRCLGRCRRRSKGRLKPIADRRQTRWVDLRSTHPTNPIEAQHWVLVARVSAAHPGELQK